MSYTIDSSIPIPSRVHLGRPLLYPWDKLEVGQSVFKPKAKPGFHGSAYQYGRTHGLTFTTRRVIEEGVKGTRVWRTA